jgi:hypothetical protein
VREFAVCEIVYEREGVCVRVCLCCRVCERVWKRV